MPPQSTSLAEEGAASDGFKIVSGGEFDAGAVGRFLSDPGKVGGGKVWGGGCGCDLPLQHAGCSAARNQADNVSDLQAQIAANQKGISLVNELAMEFGVDVVQRLEGGGGSRVLDAAAAAVRVEFGGLCARVCGGGMCCECCSCVAGTWGTFKRLQSRL